MESPSDVNPGSIPTTNKSEDKEEEEEEEEKEEGYNEEEQEETLPLSKVFIKENEFVRNVRLLYKGGVGKKRGGKGAMRFSKRNEKHPVQQEHRIHPTLLTEKGNALLVNGEYVPGGIDEIDGQYMNEEITEESYYKKRKKKYGSSLISREEHKRLKKGIVYEKRGLSIYQPREKKIKTSLTLPLEIELEERRKKEKEYDNHHHLPHCDQCGSDNPSDFVETKEFACVCTICGTVQEGTKTFEVSRIYTTGRRISNSYQRGSYISKRIKESGNLETRIDPLSLRTIRLVHSQVVQNKSLLEDLLPQRQKQQEEGIVEWDIGVGDLWISKGYIKSLLQYIDTLIVKGTELSEFFVKPHFHKKYATRWLQIKHHLINPLTVRLGGLLPKEDIVKVRRLAMVIEQCRKDENFSIPRFIKKSAGPCLNLQILMALYSYSVYALQRYGWYFVTESMFDPKSDSTIHYDFDELRETLKILNQQIEKYPGKLPFVEEDLEEGKWRIPQSLDVLKEYCKSNEFYYGLGH